MRILQQGRLPIKAWAEDIDEGALQQAINISNLPFAYSHVVLLPDVHEGFGMPIGCVLAADGIVIPNAVGVDIGCGVRVLKTDVKVINEDEISEIIKMVKKAIPVGFKHHKEPQSWEGFEKAPNIDIIGREIESAKRQLGTLGGGNHFCSIEKGSDGYIWLMLHSGSRNLGFKVANHFDKQAKISNKREKIVPPSYNLAPLELESNVGKEYFAAMKFCLEFAKMNRGKMADRFFRIFSAVTGAQKIEKVIDSHHNYAAVEEHYSRKVIVHRKGAIKAAYGDKGIVPGSMGTPSYIVEGVGNPDSFMSSAHGAGRVMSRKQANKVITEEIANRAMQGIVYGDWKGDFSEAPPAYKDIDMVIKAQSDLTRILLKLEPLGVIKG